MSEKPHEKKNKITAKHVGHGIWDFTCQAHEGEPHVMRAISGPKHAMGQMERHVDKEHPGEKFQLARSSDFSGDAHKTYIGKKKKDAK